MEIKLRKDWKRGGKTIKRNATFYVTNELGESLIKKKIARAVKPFFIPILAKKVVPDGTKQTAKKVTKKEKDGNDREI